MAVINRQPQGQEENPMPNDVTIRIADYIDRAFRWAHTDEGSTGEGFGLAWANVHNRLRYGYLRFDKTADCDSPFGKADLTFIEW